MFELKPAAARQYTDSLAVFEELEAAEAEAAQVRGGMHWKDSTYLIRTTTLGGQKSLGPRTPDTEAIYEKFVRRKAELESRVASLRDALEEHRRLNRALRVGRVEPIAVSILNRIAAAGLNAHFRVVGTHAMFAYEAAAGVRVDSEAVTTLDIDLLWDTRARLGFATKLARVDTSMLGVLKKVDKTFRMRSKQLYTAINEDGFQVDILRREAVRGDPHPVKLSDAEDDFWVVQAKRASVLLEAPEFSSVVVATNGAMARMNTVAPTTFIEFKRWMAEQPDRDPLKRNRDLLQADAVERIVKEYLPP